MKIQGIIPVFNHPDNEISKQVIDVCYTAGIRVFEFTNRDVNALEVFENLVGHAKVYPDLILGIGTILTAKDAKNFLLNGAHFIVSPALIPEIAHFCTSKNTLWIPGCGTVTEIYQAKELGAKMVKVFPGNILGPGFVKSVRAVFPNIPIMPTGGVEPSEENLRLWFDAGVTCVGMGSRLIDRELLNKDKFEELANLVTTTINTIRKVKN